jgi:dTDP-4-dehydrorhamnose reductase
LIKSNPNQVLVVGRSGQLASALARCDRRSELSYICLGRPDLDILDQASIERAIAGVEPAALINASAYTAVDRAEQDADAAMRLNAEGPGNLAEICSRLDIPLIHISTDYVFNGTADRPWRPGDPVDPISVYGRTKAAGEARIRDNHGKHLIVRSSWLFGPDGNNFLKTMLSLARERDSLSVVSDQTGAPTYVPDLACALHRILRAVLGSPGFERWGTYHLTNSGHTTWYEFAAEIFRQAEQSGLQMPRLEAIPTSAYRTDAQRPAYSVLDCSDTDLAFGITLPAWQDAIKRCLEALQRSDPGDQEEVIQ